MTTKREWLISMRIQQGMTQMQVAKIAEVDRSHYALIESGRRSPSVSTAKKIADALKFEWPIFFASKCGDKPQKSESA